MAGKKDRILSEIRGVTSTGIALEAAAALSGNTTISAVATVVSIAIIGYDIIQLRKAKQTASQPVQQETNPPRTPRLIDHGLH